MVEARRQSPSTGSGVMVKTPPVSSVQPPPAKSAETDLRALADRAECWPVAPNSAADLAYGGDARGMLGLRAVRRVQAEHVHAGQEQLPDAAAESLAGPSVATILVLGIKSGTIPFCPNMPIYQVIVLAIVQGLTEFLPVSSTAHLYLTSWLLGWQTESLTFDIALAHRHAAGGADLFRARLGADHRARIRHALGPRRGTGA